MKTFHLTVSSVSETKFEGEASSISVPGVDGQMEVLKDHAPLISTLNSGTIVIKTESDKNGEKFKIEKGILEVANNRVVVLM